MPDRPISTRLPRTPKYRLHKPSQRAVVTLDGRDHYLGRYGSEESRAQYDRVVAEWLANGRRMPGSCPGGITIDEVIAAYWRHAKTYYVKNGKPTNEQATVKVMLRVLRRLYGPTPAGQFGPRALKAVRQAMIEKDWSRKHINQQVSRLKGVFKWGVEHEIVPPSVYEAIRTVAGLKEGRSEARETERVRPVADELVDKVRPHVSRQVWAMIQLQGLTGMRSGEVTIMRGRDLDTSGKVWMYTPSTHKTEHHGRQRVIPLGPRAKAIVKPFLKRDLAECLFSPAEAEAERSASLRKLRKTRVQPSQRIRAERRRNRQRRRPPKGHYTSDSYRRAIVRACELAKIEPAWHPHQLRHSAATRLRREFGIDVARVILGHRSAAITEVYAELDKAKAVEIMAKVG